MIEEEYKTLEKRQISSSLQSGETDGSWLPPFMSCNSIHYSNIFKIYFHVLFGVLLDSFGSEPDSFAT